MGRAPCCEKEGLRRGAWSPDEDERLVAYIRRHGHPNWRALPKQAGLLRCGKSCRLRWINYLRPDIKRGNFTAAEEDLIVRLHHSLGNRWSAIAAQLPGRTDNEIKNVWHTHLKKRLDDERKVTGGGGRRQQPRKQPKAAKSAAAAAAKRETTPSVASPRRSSSSVDTSSGATCSTVTESAAAVSSPSPSSAHGHHHQHQQVAVKEESFSSGELPVPMMDLADMDESFWSSTDVTGMMDLGDMDEELSLAGSSTARSEDMEFWLKMLLESGDMRDLAVL
ncbi:hypothetical protein E2562_021550 [Oryza meyeriana var. granulata]|uniref:Uncharacterized protein n=1 Tax=Oryza meyeriana var. granulata TaxID=110450 RepID=A0A6G1EXT2_9ORYZ|nr:hypothetical protein E2562_021550 [Oryza meyeriana var. granulata]